MLVLDCSIAMAWAFEDEADETADAVLDELRSMRAAVPAVWPLEVANVLATAERRGRLKIAESAHFLALLAGLPIVVEQSSFERVTSSVLELARRHRLSAYDAAYLELAARRGASLATNDRTLTAAAAAAGVQTFTRG